MSARALASLVARDAAEAGELEPLTSLLVARDAAAEASELEQADVTGC